MDQNQAAQGEDVSVIFEYGNEGDVSTLNPVTFMGYFDLVDDYPTNSIEPTPLTFDFFTRRSDKNRPFSHSPLPSFLLKDAKPLTSDL